MLKLSTLMSSSMLSFFLVMVFIQPVQAGMVGTADLISSQGHSQAIASQRQSIQQQLVELGVDPMQAGMRVSSMSDSEVAEITQKISDLPAGADAGGILLTLFIVFVITDVIGATDIFPFINPVR
jgi:hypothetical protein